ncbi:hypothetical protein CSC94_21525 [Zhengella mangrovi]|uniref:Gamma-butyrobetaine hydroxylase-like N-terminal domain-containing protein n=1 Tax=Zhengella mangrovi TaxID=1982044 RepID=A0A2G1QH97_9HYPH|nr:DUF971 domain-containing protein [Zhengella mangrovi]PHP64917.1 hypothetical protein CSC94_21525 [Zhengella mangrovi]
MDAPSEIRLSKDKRTLTVTFDDAAYAFSAEMMRVMSPSAEVQGHSPSERKLVSGKRDVGIMAIVPVGNYAIRVAFDDMHDTGIFTWAWFREHGRAMDEKWQAYLDELAQKGLSRDPARR